MCVREISTEKFSSIWQSAIGDDGVEQFRKQCTVDTRSNCTYTHFMHFSKQLQITGDDELFERVSNASLKVSCIPQLSIETFNIYGF